MSQINSTSNQKVSSKVVKFASLNDSVHGDNGEPPMSDLERRVRKLEDDVSAIKQDVAIMKSNYATREDLAKEIGSVKTAIAESTTTQIKWFIATICTIVGLIVMVMRFVK